MALFFKYILVFSIVIFSTPFSEASTKKAPQSVDSTSVSLDQFLASLQKSKGLKADLKKTARLELLDRVEVQTGNLYLQPGAIRLEFNEPAQNVAVISQKNFWTIEYPPKSSKEPVRVLKGKLDKNSAANLLLHNVLAQGKWKGLLKPKKRTDENGEVKFEMLSDGPLKSQLKQVTLIFNKNTKQLKNLIYVDDLGNKTDLELNNIQFDMKLDKNLFVYDPPKNSEITEL